MFLKCHLYCEIVQHFNINGLSEITAVFSVLDSSKRLNIRGKLWFTTG